MTVGSGSPSANAAALTALLDDDSGYGGSIAGDGSMASGWHPGMTEDRPTPAHTSVLPGESNAACTFFWEFNSWPMDAKSVDLQRIMKDAF